MMLEQTVMRWSIIVLGSTSISAGLVVPLAKTEKAKAVISVVAFTCAGTALILTQA